MGDIITLKCGADFFDTVTLNKDTDGTYMNVYGDWQEIEGDYMFNRSISFKAMNAGKGWVSINCKTTYLFRDRRG